MIFLIFQISTEKCFTIKSKKNLAHFIFEQTGLLVSPNKKASELIGLLPKNDFALMKGE